MSTPSGGGFVISNQIGRSHARVLDDIVRNGLATAKRISARLGYDADYAKDLLQELGATGYAQHRGAGAYAIKDAGRSWLDGHGRHLLVSR